MTPRSLTERSEFYVGERLGVRCDILICHHYINIKFGSADFRKLGVSVPLLT